MLTLLAPRLNLPPGLILILAVLGLAFVLNIPAGRVAAGLRATRLGPMDSLLGVGLQLAILFVVAYLGVATLADAERAVKPLLTKPITTAAVDSFAASVRRDAFLSTLVRPDQLTADRRLAVAGRLTLPVMEIDHPWIRLYVDAVRPALLQSRLAPIVLHYGDGLPLVGRPGTAMP